MQPPSRPQERERRRDHGQGRDGADRAEGAERDHEDVAERPEERIGAEVRRQNEEVLLEGRPFEPVAHGDQARVGRKVLKRERVEQPEDEHRGEGQRAHRDPARSPAHSEGLRPRERDAEVRRNSRGG